MIRTVFSGMEPELKIQELISVIMNLLNCPDLWLDDLDQTTIEAIDKARKVLKKYGKDAL